MFSSRNVYFSLAFVLAFIHAAGVFTPAYAAPKASFSTVKIEYGTLREGKVAEAVVTISNTGDQPLEIQRVQSSCPCVTTDFPESGVHPVVKPGDSYPLTVRYDSKGVFGDRVATIVVGTSDPNEPMTAIDVEVFVEALVVSIPDKAVAGVTPRGEELSDEVVFFSGTSARDIELLDIHMEQPSMTVMTEREESKEKVRIKARFKLAADAPLGPVANVVSARFRVGEEEATLQVPVQAEAVGDVLVMPQSIVAAPRLAYTQNQPLSKDGIIVRASRPNEPIPDVLGVIAVGPITCIVHKNVKPDWAPSADRHLIEVRTAENAGPGPQSGTVYVMTTSRDQPIVSIPVFFRMASRVTADPTQVVLDPVPGAPATQRVVLRDATGAALTIQKVNFEQDLLDVKIEREMTLDGDTPASIVVNAATIAPKGREATMISVVTDQPGAERILIPVLIRRPTTP
jgi:hypothetical protein